MKVAKQALAGLFSLCLLGKIDLRFADETAFRLEPNVPYGWIKIGRQRGIRSSKGGGLNVFGLLNYQGDLTSYVTQGRVNSATIIEWLSDFAGQLEQPTVVVLDNAPWHCSAAVKAKVQEWQQQGLELFYLPAYCPHLNVIETLWRKMKYEWLCPQDYRSAKKLRARVKKLLRRYGKGRFDIEFNLEDVLS